MKWPWISRWKSELLITTARNDYKEILEGYERASASAHKREADAQASADASHKTSLHYLAEVDELRGQLAAANIRADLAAKGTPWVKGKGISGGAFHSDGGTDISWPALDERMAKEANAFRGHPGYKAILDLIEGRLITIFKGWIVEPDAVKAERLHQLARCYEDILGFLDMKTSTQERKIHEDKLAERRKLEQERDAAIRSAGRSPFF